MMIIPITCELYIICEREREKRGREKENERETTCSNVLENKMNYALLQSFNRTLSNRSGFVAVTVKNTKTGTRVIVSSIFGVQYYFRYAERSNARIGAD